MRTSASRSFALRLVTLLVLVAAGLLAPVSGHTQAFPDAQVQTSADFEAARRLPLFPRYHNPLSLIDPATGPWRHLP